MQVPSKTRVINFLITNINHHFTADSIAIHMDEYLEVVQNNLDDLMAEGKIEKIWKDNKNHYKFK